MASADNINVQALNDARASSWRALDPWRKNLRKAVKHHVGNRWSENGADRPNYLNLTGTYISVVGRSLVPKDPRLMLGTFNREAKPLVTAMEGWANRQIERLYVGETLQRTVTQAQFVMGITKVALGDPVIASLSGYSQVAGDPFLEDICFDDWVHDTHAPKLRQCRFMGHRFRAPYEVVKESPLFPKSMRKKVEPKEDNPYDIDGGTKLRQMGAGDSMSEGEFEPHVDMWEIYLPGYKKVLWLMDGFDEPFRVFEWVGPECGPYHFLGFGDVIGNAMPLAPIQSLIDLSELTNALFRKLGRQALRQKTLMAVTGQDSDAERVTGADDGQGIKVDRPDGMKELNFGGPNQQNWAMAQTFYNLFNVLGGGLETLGGTAAQTNTVGQEQLLQQGASQTVAGMAEKTRLHVLSAFKSLCWFWWNHPESEMRSVFRLPGPLDLAVPQKVTAAQRHMVPFDQLEIDVDPYSMVPDTPQSRIAALDETIMQLAPMLPVMAQQGIMLNFSEWLKLKAKYRNMPDLQQILSYGATPTQEPGPSQGPAGYQPQQPDGRTSMGVENDPRANERQAMQGMMEQAMTPEPSMNGAA
jgi:hypothetical protein